MTAYGAKLGANVRFLEPSQRQQLALAVLSGCVCLAHSGEDHFGDRAALTDMLETIGARDGVGIQLRKVKP